MFLPISSEDLYRREEVRKISLKHGTRVEKSNCKRLKAEENTKSVEKAQENEWVQRK